MKEIFNGSCVALITPFKKNKIDFEKLKSIIDFQILSGTDAILILGTTGESPTIGYEEREKIINVAKKQIDGRAKLFVGTGSNSTKTTIELSKKAEQLGADALLVVTPYYNKCTQEGLFLHYSEVAKNVKTPIILYNVPSRTGVNILPETAKRLSRISNIVGIKEANQDERHIKEMMLALKDEIAVYSGNDDLNYEFLKNGASGVISVTANLFPELVKEVCDLAKDKNFSAASELCTNLSQINKAMFIETNPIPVKYGASYKNMCENELRLPLTPLSEENRVVVEKSIDETAKIK